MKKYSKKVRESLPRILWEFARSHDSVTIFEQNQPKFEYKYLWSNMVICWEYKIHFWAALDILKGHRILISRGQFYRGLKKRSKSV